MVFEPDAENYRQDVSVRGMAVAVVFAAAGVGFSVTNVGERWLGANPGTLMLVFAFYVSIYAANVYSMKRGELLLRPGWWPLRVLGCTAAASIGCCFAAASRFDASAAWGLHLVIGVAIGIAVRPTPWMLLVLVLPALVVRAVSVPAATPLSYGVLVVACIGSFALYWRTSKLIQNEREYAAGAEAAGSLAREAESLSAEFRVAMSLHDGLSGALSALRSQVARASSVAEARAIARPWILRARRFLHRSPHDEPIEPALERLASSLGVSLELDCHVVERELEPSERADLQWIASELVANAAAHDPQARLRLSVRASRQAVRLEAGVGSRRISERRGRGMRNIELRAAHHGGRLVWSEDALQISWRHREPLDEILWRAAIEVFIVVIVFGACLIAIDRRPGPVLVAAVAILFLLVAFWDRFSRTNRARTELARAERRRLEAEEGELLLLAGEALEPGVRRAQEALAGLRLRGLGEALDRLALDLRDVMWALEWTGDLAGLRADVADLAREARISSPLVPPSAVEDARERWRLISSLRRCTPVCAPRADASAPDRIVVR